MADRKLSAFSIKHNTAAQASLERLFNFILFCSNSLRNFLSDEFGFLFVLDILKG